MSIVNPHLLTQLTSIQQSLMAQHSEGYGLPNTTIGFERETFLREFLAKVFPSPYRFATGALTDSTGKLSGQIDIAVDNPFLPGFPMSAGGGRLLLAESVAAVLEIKSNLRSQWMEVERITEEVTKLERRGTGLARPGGNGGHPVAARAAHIPCIAVGYTGFTTIEGLKERLATASEEGRPDAAYVIATGCFLGFGLEATGPLGLYALCVVLSNLMVAFAAANPDLLSYVETQKSGDQPSASEQLSGIIPDLPAGRGSSLVTGLDGLWPRTALGGDAGAMAAGSIDGYRRPDGLGPQ